MSDPTPPPKSPPPKSPPPESPAPDWRRELAVIDRLMREVSRQTDPQEMVRIYGDGIDELFPTREFVAVSRRGLAPPRYRVTRSSRFTEDINPWTQKDRLPVIEGGILGELLYANQPRVIGDFEPDPGDPAYEHLKGMRTIAALPQYDDGVALNVAFMLWSEPDALDMTRFPYLVWSANLFGRATHNMVLRRELAAAYDLIDRELQVVGDIQRSLLPETLPRIEGLELAAAYQTSRRAGGDYYDLFPLPGGEWGIFIADVSGHGTPAAVVMAITHAIAHAYPGPAMPPGDVLAYLNRTLTRRYTGVTGSFVTAFYAVYNPRTRALTYGRAGHNPPRRQTRGRIEELDSVGGLPLGIEPDQTYEQRTVTLERGDLLLLYTDGVTEAFDPEHRIYGEGRLDELVARHTGSATELVSEVLRSVEAFARGRLADDDRTLLAARVT